MTTPPLEPSATPVDDIATDPTLTGEFRVVRHGSLSSAPPPAAAPVNLPDDDAADRRARRWWVLGLVSLVVLMGAALWWNISGRRPGAPAAAASVGTPLIELELVSKPPGARAVIRIADGPRLAVPSTPATLEFEPGLDLTITFHAAGHTPAVVKHQVRTNGRVEADLAPSTVASH